TRKLPTPGGRLSCTRENDPVRDASGKQHTNKCLMCAEKLRRSKFDREQPLSQGTVGCGQLLRSFPCMYFAFQMLSLYSHRAYAAAALI
uniref:Kazal-like domain-containing protein n=1 Tax=Otus sunia TaxID=257818 RepID=A0A8C8AJ18_9STRI